MGYNEGQGTKKPKSWVELRAGGNLRRYGIFWLAQIPLQT